VTATYDVVVLGGGPAGAAVATALARRRRTVELFERSDYARPRAGETLGPEVQSLLESLGLGDHGAPLLPFLGVRSAWGGAELVERASIAHPLGEGWHVDRARFDEGLVRCAKNADVSVRLRCGHCKVERATQGFLVRSTAGETVSARFLIDATGRGAPGGASALGEGKWLQFDRLVALLGRMTPPGSQSVDPELLLEAEENGWWYSAPQPDGTLLVAFMTDSDLWPARGRTGLTERWEAALARTAHTRARVGEAKLQGPIDPVRADSGLLLSDRGDHWMAIGDAAMACDPLAGNGVARALLSAIAAAAQVDHALDGQEILPSTVEAAFVEYLDRRARYYGVEHRWSSSLFWARRRPIDWARSPITLAPATMLHWNGARPRPLDLAAVEALLPHRAITDALDLLRTPQSAHEVLQKLRSRAPLGDRRLLVGLQLLVERAPVAICPTLATETA
jgi:flavin-dependent dehydrogenase